MQTSQRSLMVGRAFLVTVAVSTLAACDRYETPLAPLPSQPVVAPGVAAEMGRRPASATLMTREEARKKGIEHARAALAGARAGAVTGLSDGRKLTGADAVLLWERALRALESGSSQTHVWRTAGAPSESASASMSDGYGYVWGTTNVNRQWAYATATSLTLGNGAQGTFLSGDLEVFLARASSNHYQSKSEYKMYMAYAQGDFVSGEVQIDWDYNWIGEYAIASTYHSADYGEYHATTTSSAVN